MFTAWNYRSLFLLDSRYLTLVARHSSINQSLQAVWNRVTERSWQGHRLAANSSGAPPHPSWKSFAFNVIVPANTEIRFFSQQILAHRPAWCQSGSSIKALHQPLSKVRESDGLGVKGQALLEDATNQMHPQAATLYCRWSMRGRSVIWKSSWDADLHVREL